MLNGPVGPGFDPYRVLQVSDDAESEVIEAAYRRLCRKYHPDVSGVADAEARMRQINVAFEIVGDPERRRAFDVLRRRIQDTVARRPPLGEGPVLLVNSTVFRLRGSPGGPRPTARFDVANRGGGLLAGNARPSAPWLRVSPSSFAANRLTFELRAEIAGLEREQPHEATVEILTNGGQASVFVEVLVCGPAGQLRINPAELDFGQLGPGQTRSLQLHLDRPDPGDLDGEAVARGDWLAVRPARFHGRQVDLVVAADPAHLHAFWTARAPESSPVEGAVEIRTNAGVAHVPIRAVLTRSRGTLDRLLSGIRGK